MLNSQRQSPFGCSPHSVCHATSDTLKRGRHTALSRRLVHVLLRWFSRNARDLPWRRTRDPYGLWVSEIMLQQTQVKAVLGFWERWMMALRTFLHSRRLQRKKYTN